jgi:DNA-binding transcriptional LysR family regulator
VSTVGDALDDLLVEFVADFPEVSLEVIETSRVVNLVAEGIDVAVRFGPIRDVNLVARHIADIKRVVVAAPQYLDQYGEPECPEDLTAHHCIVGFAADGGPAKSWPLRDGARIPVAGRVAQNGVRLARAAALGGLGLALLTKPFVRDDVSSGALRVVLPDLVGDSVAVSIVFPERDYLAPKVREFVNRAVPVLKAAYADE